MACGVKPCTSTKCSALVLHPAGTRGQVTRWSLNSHRPWEGVTSQCAEAGMPDRSQGSAAPNSEELFELIVDSSTDFAIFTTDLEGIVTSWNVGAARLFGYPENEIIGSSGDVIFTPEDRDAGAHEKERLQARSNGRALDERWHQRKDGSRFWASGLLMRLRRAEAGFVKITR